MPNRKPGLGTLLRHLVELLDGDLERTYAEMGLDYRPRYTPVYRVLIARRQATIRDITQQAGVTHSAVSQTVAHMAKHDLVKLSPGQDRRQRLVELTPKGLALRERVERQWTVTTLAAQQLDQELSVPLSNLLMEAIETLQGKRFYDRIKAVRDTDLPGGEAA